ncbi:hypothetical protein F5051DRAFT_444371 [Lentinula edodes]|nr:hypothetical protein F5051DRAFT_444371 [Lentinula edodes]
MVKVQTRMTEKSLIETISAVNIELNTQRANVTKHSNELKKLQTINQDAVHLKKNMAQSLKGLEQRIKNMTEANHALGNECKHQKEELSDLRARKDMLGKQVALLKKSIRNQGSIIKDAATEKGLFRQNLHSVELEKVELKRLLKIKDTAIQAADRRSNQLKLKVQNLENLAETEERKADQELKAVLAKNHELENSLKMKIHQLMVYVKEIEVLKGREAETTSLYNTAMKDLKTFEQHNRELQLTIHHAKHIETDEARQLNDIRAQYNDLKSMIRSAGSEAPQTSRKREVEPIGRINEKTGDFCPYKEWERIQSSYQAVTQMKDQELQSKISEINSYKSAISGIENVANDKLNSLQQQNKELQSIVTSQNIKVRYVEELAIQLKTFISTNHFDLNLIHQVQSSTEYPQVQKFQELEGFMLEIQSILCSYKCKNDEELQAKDRELDNFKQWAETQINQRDSTLRDLQNLRDGFEQELCRFRGMQKAQVKELRTARKRVIKVLADDQDLDDRVQETEIQGTTREMEQELTELWHLLRIAEHTLKVKNEESRALKQDKMLLVTTVQDQNRILTQLHAQSVESKFESRIIEQANRRQECELTNTMETLNDVVHAQHIDVDDEGKNAETLLQINNIALITAQEHMPQNSQRSTEEYNRVREALEVTKQELIELQTLCQSMVIEEQVKRKDHEVLGQEKADLKNKIEEKDRELAQRDAEVQTLRRASSDQKIDLDHIERALKEEQNMVSILNGTVKAQGEELNLLKLETEIVVNEKTRALTKAYTQSAGLKDEWRKIKAELGLQNSELEQTKLRQVELDSSLEILNDVVHARCREVDALRDGRKDVEILLNEKNEAVITARKIATDLENELWRIQEERNEERESLEETQEQLTQLQASYHIIATEGQVKKHDLQMLTQEKADLETIIEEKNRGLAQKEIELQTIRGISSALEKDLHSTKQAFDEKENSIRILKDTLEAQDKDLEAFRREAEINIKEKTRELAEAYAQSAELKDEWQKMKAELWLQNTDLDQIKRQQTELNSSLEILNNVLYARCRELDALRDEKRDVETILQKRITALIAGQRHFVDLNKELRRIQKVYTGEREALKMRQKDPTRLHASGTVTSGKQVLGQYLEAQERSQANLETEFQEKDTVLQTPQTLFMMPSAHETDLHHSIQVLNESKAFVRILEDILEVQSKQLEVLKQEKGTVIEENRQALGVIYELKDELRKIEAEHKQQDFELEQTKQRQADFTSSLETLHSVVHTRCLVLDGFEDEKSIAEAAEKSKNGVVITARAGGEAKDLPRIQEEQSGLETTVVQHLANLSIDPGRSVIAEDRRHELDTSNNAKSSETQDQDNYRSSKFQGLVDGRRDKKYSVRHLLFLNDIALRYCTNKVEKEQETPRPGKSRQEKVEKSRFVALQNAYNQQTVECLVDNPLKPLLNASQTQLEETQESLSKEVYSYQNKLQRAMPKADALETSKSESEKKLQTTSDRNVVLQTQLLLLQSDIAQQERESQDASERQPDDGACADISALEKRPALWGGLKKSFRGTDVKAKLARRKYA